MDIWQQIEQDAREAAYKATWGHLAPKKGVKYVGRIVFAIGAYDSGYLNPTILVSEFDEIDSSPWYYDAVHRWLSDLCSHPVVQDPDCKRHARSGCVFEWRGTFRNYKFVGKVKLLLDANK